MFNLTGFRGSYHRDGDVIADVVDQFDVKAIFDDVSKVNISTSNLKSFLLIEKSRLWQEVLTFKGRNFYNFSLEIPEFFEDLYLRLTNETKKHPQNRLLYPFQNSAGAVFWVLPQGI